MRIVLMAAVAVIQQTTLTDSACHERDQAPVLGLKRVAPGEALEDAGREIAGDRRFTLRSAVVIVQIAVSLVLVVAAGLFLRTFASLNQLPLGFAPVPLLTVELNLQASGGPPEDRAARVGRLRDSAAAVPGVRSASVSAIRLLTGGGWASGLVGIGDGPISRSSPPLWLNATTRVGSRPWASRCSAVGTSRPVTVSADAPWPS